MAFNDLFKVYPNRNAELRAVARQAFEFGKTVAREQSSAMSNGLLSHGKERQEQYLVYVKRMIDALHAAPIPDLPGTHPLSLDINLSEKYTTFTVDVNGEEVPLNEQTELLSQYWMILAVELATSQSASIAGSLTDADHKRALANIAAMEKLLAAMTGKPDLDVPETSVPGATYGTASDAK